MKMTAKISQDKAIKSEQPLRNVFLCLARNFSGYFYTLTKNRLCKREKREPRIDMYRKALHLYAHLITDLLSLFAGKIIFKIRRALKAQSLSRPNSYKSAVLFLDEVDSKAAYFILEVDELRLSCFIVVGNG